jgi:outer membrane biosynthesis protein TonB
VTSIVIAMVVIVLVAAVFIAYVAFPHRGEDLPGAPWLGRLMRRGAEALPTVDDELTVPVVPAEPASAAGPQPETVVPTEPIEPIEPVEGVEPVEPAAPVDRPTGPGRHRGDPTA